MNRSYQSGEGTLAVGCGTDEAIKVNVRQRPIRIDEDNERALEGVRGLVGSASGEWSYSRHDSNCIASIRSCMIQCMLMTRCSRWIRICSSD